MDARREAQQMQQAVKVTEWSGPVWWCDHYGSLGNGYFRDGDELVDEIRDERLAVPAYVFLATAKPVVECLHIRLIESICHDHAWEGFEFSALLGIEALEKAIDEFKRLNKKVAVHHRDHKRAISLVNYLGEKMHAELLEEMKT